MKEARSRRGEAMKTRRSCRRRCRWSRLSRRRQPRLVDALEQHRLVADLVGEQEHEAGVEVGALGVAQAFVGAEPGFVEAVGIGDVAGSVFMARSPFVCAERGAQRGVDRAGVAALAAAPRRRRRAGPGRRCRARRRGGAAAVVGRSVGSAGANGRCGQRAATPASRSTCRGVARPPEPRKRVPSARQCISVVASKATFCTERRRLRAARRGRIVVGLRHAAGVRRGARELVPRAPARRRRGAGDARPALRGARKREVRLVMRRFSFAAAWRSSW